MSTTIRDVAKRAGVSTATISRYLNNSPFIAYETAERVREVMQELQYSPNSIARNFTNQVTKTIAFIVDSQNTTSFGNPYFLQIQYGIEKVLGMRGYYLMIVNIGNRSHGENELIKLISEKRVDGIIIPAILIKKNTIRKINECNFPCVVFGQQKETTNVSWVDLDNVMGGELAAAHLIRNSCKEIAFIGCSFKKLFVSQRMEGYKNALTKNKIGIIQDLIIEGGEGKFKGYEIMNRLLSQRNPPDGFVFSDNLAAFGAISAVKAKSIKIPEEIQIVSFDDSLVAELSEPEMTVIDIDMFDLGSQAATMLLKQLETPSQNKQHSMISVKLICRGTSKNALFKEEE